jgi:hypothetical protein
MSYELVGALRERYLIPAFAFGGGTLSRTLQGPPGKKGLVRDVLATVTTAMVGTTSVPEIRVGTAASDNSFARWLLGTTAILGYGTGIFRARSLTTNAQGRVGNYPAALVDFAHHIFLEGNDTSGTASLPGTSNGQTFIFLPADTAFFITGVAGVGGSPAGTADVYVDIDWF